VFAHPLLTPEQTAQIQAAMGRPPIDRPAGTRAVVAAKEERT
jgi:hypothetical protein